MAAYEVFKDIAVPLFSPLVAAGALVLAFRVEQKKLAAQREHALASAVEAARREVLQLCEAYQLIGIYVKKGQTPEPERLAAFDESAKRLFRVFHENPRVYEEYFSANERGIVGKRLPLLLHELEVKLAQVRPASAPDTFIQFALYILLYARAGYRQDSEEFEILETPANSNNGPLSAWWNTA